MHSPKITFGRSTLDFFPELRRRVDRYFAEQGISRHANGAMVVKTIIIIGMFVGCYLSLILLPLPGWVLLILAGVFGFASATLGMNIGHDALHGAYSSNGTVNRILGWLFNAIGADDHVWKNRHNIVHHTYTNIPGHDDDIEQVSLLRFHTSQNRKAIHRFQHIYVFLLYPLAPFPWVFYSDFVNFFRRDLRHNKNQPTRNDIMRLFLFKAAHFFLFIVMPFIMISQPWYWILTGIVLFYLVIGFVLSFVFQLAHVVDETTFPVPDDTGRVPDAWAIHQLQTTADFAPESPLAGFLFGGLNFQVEHHLFPNVCHIHYPKLRPIVQATAAEFGLRHLENRTLMSAVKSHLRYLRELGRR